MAHLLIRLQVEKRLIWSKVLKSHVNHIIWVSVILHGRLSTTKDTNGSSQWYDYFIEPLHKLRGDYTGKVVIFTIGETFNIWENSNELSILGLEWATVLSRSGINAVTNRKAIITFINLLYLTFHWEIEVFLFFSLRCCIFNFYNWFFRITSRYNFGTHKWFFGWGFKFSNWWELFGILGQFDSH